MSGNDSSQSSAYDPKWWVNGAWRDVTPDILTPGSSPYAFAINADEFPDLAQAIVSADDISGYLRAIGVSENSIVDHATTIARADAEVETDAEVEIDAEGLEGV
jgi:hypothetical protein